MHANNLFEYAIIRYVPRPEREEFLNIGVILFCAKKQYLNLLYRIDVERITCFYPAVDVDMLQHFLEGYHEVCCGKSTGSPIARLDNPSRFRWLTATRSTIIQSSKIHPGLCVHPQQTLERLYNTMVL